MIQHLRTTFNEQFTEEKYARILDWIELEYGHRPPFKIAETPVFIPENLKHQLIEAGEEIIDVIVDPSFKEKSQGAMMPDFEVPGETEHPAFLSIDFGICSDENGGVIPQLIEAQGFPSLFHYQTILAKAYREYYEIPIDYKFIFGNQGLDEYLALLHKIIVGSVNPQNVVLLEIEPYKQPTAIDFIVAEALLGIKVLCVSEVIKEGNRLFYIDDKGVSVPIYRIYNRVIFDELAQRTDLPRQFSFLDEVDVEWVGHPNWFFRISKHMLPYLKSQYVPTSYLLSELAAYPEDLENYVLKPLFSFSGAGVILDVTPEDLERIDQPDQFLLQKKVSYSPLIETLDVPAKCEIRLLYAWPSGDDRPTLMTNLCRLSKGAMIGVRYNKNKTWVGGSVGFFQP